MKNLYATIFSAILASGTFGCGQPKEKTAPRPDNYAEPEPDNSTQNQQLKNYCKNGPLPKGEYAFESPKANTTIVYTVGSNNSCSLWLYERNNSVPIMIINDFNCDNVADSVILPPKHLFYDRDLLSKMGEAEELDLELKYQHDFACSNYGLNKSIDNILN